MNEETLSQLWEEQEEHEKRILKSRKRKYTTDGDRLANFKHAGMLEKCPPLKALRGMLTKPIVALYDLIDRTNGHIGEEDIKDFVEYITDIRNYLVLAKGIVIEERDERIYNEREFGEQK